MPSAPRLQEMRSDPPDTPRASHNGSGNGGYGERLAKLEDRMESVTTREDIAKLEARMESVATREDLAKLEARMESVATREDIAKLEVLIAEKDSSRTKWLLGVMVTVALTAASLSVAVTVSVLRLPGVAGQ